MPYLTHLFYAYWFFLMPSNIMQFLRKMHIFFSKSYRLYRQFCHNLDACFCSVFLVSKMVVLLKKLSFLKNQDFRLEDTKCQKLSVEKVYSYILKLSKNRKHWVCICTYPRNGLPIWTICINQKKNIRSITSQLIKKITQISLNRYSY